MKPIDPRVDPSRVPANSKAVVIAEHQEEYVDLPSVRTPAGQVITRWELNEEERQAIANGEDLFIMILSNGPINPILPTVGAYDFKEFEKSLLKTDNAS